MTGLPHRYQDQPLLAGGEDNRSAMARASDAAPFKPYVYGGGELEPPEVLAARERHRALNAEIERARALAALAGLEAARKAAWQAYDTIARAMPDCEHMRQWREQAAAARRAHLQAIRACDKAIQEAGR